MKLVISPAKSLNYESELPTGFSSQNCFLNEASSLINVLKKKSTKELSDLMNISSKISAINYERNQQWQLPFNSNNARQAIYAFSGDVYQGLDSYSIPKNKIDRLQDTVRIISGLYGILKPMDLIQPYRLEMGTKFQINKSKNLYEFWRSKVTSFLNDEMKQDEILVNLASQEYFKAIDIKVLKAKLIHIDFKEFKNGNYKTIAIFSKRARGLMTRFIVENNAQTVEDIKVFNLNRYRYDKNLSSENRLVFTR